MAYFYDIDDEEEKKKRELPQATSSSSKGYFQEIEEPVKQELEVKQEPVKEDVAPLAQQPVKQEPVKQVEQKPKNKIYGAINNAISFATGKMQEWGFVGESRGIVSKEKEKSLQQKDFEMTSGFSGENIPVVRNEMLKTNARDHIEYLDKVQKEVEELKQDNTLYLAKKRKELKESGQEFDARQLLEYKQKRLKEIALEMGYFSKESLKEEDVKDITFKDVQAEGLLSFIKEDKYLAQQNITLNDEVLGKVPVDKNVWNQIGKAVKSKTYLPSLLKGREAEFQEDYLLAMEAIQQGASVGQLTPNQRSAIIRQTNKDWENMVDRGLLAEAPQGLSDMTGYMVDLAIATVLSGGNPLIAGGVEQITSLPKTVQRVRANTEDQFTFIPIDDKDGFRIMTTKLGTEDDVKGTVSALAGGYIETAVELLLGKGIDKLLGAGGTKLASSGVGKKVLEAPITKKLGEGFVVKSISKVDNFLKKSPTAKFILQSTGLDSIAGEIAEELVQDMTNSITSGDEYEISTDYIADVASHTALLTFIAGGATRLGGAMTDAQAQAFVNEVNGNKQAFGLPETAELNTEGRVVDTETQQDITEGILDGSQIVDKTGAFEEEVQETEGLEGQTEGDLVQESVPTEQVSTEIQPSVSETASVQETETKKTVRPVEQIDADLDTLYKVAQELSDAQASYTYMIEDKDAETLYEKYGSGKATDIDQKKDELVEIVSSYDKRIRALERERDASEYASPIPQISEEVLKGKTPARQDILKRASDVYRQTLEQKNLGENIDDTTWVLQRREQIENPERFGKISEVKNAKGIRIGDTVKNSEGEIGLVTSISISDSPVDEGRVSVSYVTPRHYGGWNYIEDVEKVKEAKPPKTQKEQVKEVLAEGEAKSIKQIAEETKIKEPNIRRILGVGTKEGEFSRVAEGVYVLKTESGQVAYIETGNALESLPRLAKEGFKADMVFLDIPYDTPAVKGGNRGMKYNFITPEEFGEVLDSVNTILASENSPVIYMFSQAKSGWAKMQKYNEMLDEKGLKVIAKGEWQKRFQNGEKVTNVRGEVAQPEGILLLSQSGEIYKDIVPIDLNFDFVRPKGYQSEKNADMIKEMIQLTTNTGDVVLDPFAGSGVVPAEAIKAGRSAVAIEVDKKVVEETIKPRVEKASKEVKVEGLVGENQKRFAHKGYEFITTESTPRATPSPVPLDTSKKVLMLYGQTEDGWTFVENKIGLEPFTDKQLDEFIGKYKDRLIKQAPKEQKAGDDKVAMLESKAQSEYEKSWDKLTPQQQYKVLMGLMDGERYIKTTDQDTLTKLGKGVGIMSSKDFTERNIDVLLYKGLEEKMYTDGMVLVTDSKVANELNKKFIQQYVKASAKAWKVSEQEASKRIKEGVKDKEFPATKDILDSAKANHKLTPIGFYTDGSIRQTGSIIFRAENGTLVRLSGKYYSAIKSFYPSAEFYITDESNVKPISFMVGKSRKGVVMPMVMPSDSSFDNLTGTTKLTAQEQENINRAAVMNDADVKADIKDEFFAEIVYEKKAEKDIPYREGVISHGAGKYKFDKYGITVNMADGREYYFLIGDIYDEITEQVKEEDRRSKLTKKERERAEDDDIAFYTTARRREQRRYDDITSMADIRRNLDILRKDRLRKGGLNVQENSKLVSNLLKYIGGNVKLSKQDIDTLYSQAIGVDELQYDPNGYTTLYRIGEVEVGKQTAFSATKTDSENDIAYKVHRDDIVIYLNSQEFKDSLKNVDISLVEGSNSIENLQEVFETYGRVEDEVIATPREVREGGDDQLMLTDSTRQPVVQEKKLSQEESHELGLLKEAYKFDNAEDFIDHYRGSSTQYGGYTPSLRKHGVSESSARITDLGVDPDLTVTIYRGIDDSEGKIKNANIRDGDFVTTDYDSANAYTGGRVVSKEVKAKDLIIEFESDFDINDPFFIGAEFIYSKSSNKIIKYTDEQLRDFYNRTQQLGAIKSWDEWERERKYIQRTGEIPTTADIKGFRESKYFNMYGENGGKSEYYEYVSEKLDQTRPETLKTKEDESKGSQSLETYEAREVTPAEQLKMSDGVKALVHKYADKVGEKYLPRGVLGVFYGKTKEIRLKGITDLYVASHEISHAIDKKYDITAKITARDSVDMQLREAYINLYPTAKETHAVKTQKLEGFAMAVATYLQRPSSFTQEYPVIVKEMFTQGGKYYNTEIGEYLNDVSNIVSRYQGLNDLDRVATRISKSIPTVEQTLFKSKTEATVNMLQNDLNLFERWVRENGDTMTKADFTNLFRFRTQVKQIYENNIATNLSKKNVEEGKFKNFMGGLYSYIRKSVAQDTYYAYNPETKNIERKHDFNWGTLRREVAQKGVDRQFNSLLVARRAYYDFEYADKLKAEIETIKADLEKQQDELIEMYQKKEGDRNKRDEKAKEVEIAGTKVILQEVESNLADVESLLRNDGWDRRLVTDSYLNNQGLFEKELDMFDKLVAEDILLAKNVGIISQEKYNELKDNKGYAPFKRIIYDEVLGEVDPSEISGNLKLGSKEISSLKKRTGSTKEIIYPLQSAMRNHMEFLNKSVSQDAINTFLTDRTMEMHSANIKKVEWHKGIENQKDIIIKMEDGVRKAYAVDPMIKELLSGYLSPKQVDLLEKVQQSYKQLFTMGTTGTYFQFVFTNLPRDAFNYITQTYQSNSIKAVYNLFADTAKVVLGKNPDNNLELQYFQKYLALGGREMTFIKYMEGDYDAFTTFLRQEEKGLKKIKNTVGKVAKVGLDILSMPSQLSEMWYRSVEFIEAKKSGDSDVVALEKARRVTTPFHHRGSFKYKDSKGNITKAPNIPKYAPFQNAALQAFAWSGGNFIKDPKIRSRMLLMVGLTTAIGLEELLRAWSGAGDDDKEQFKDLTAEDLSRFIHIPKKGGGIRRIAVAEWAGSIAGTINMAVMDFILEDDVDYSVTDYTTALTTSLPDQFNLLPAVVKLIEKGTRDEFGKWGTSLLPALANPIIAIMGYKTYPEFAPLESSWQKTKLPADRYNEGTSKLAKWAMNLELPFDKGRLGDLMNLSPIQLDAILTQSFGRTIGMITGKPDAWNVLKSVNREYYFEYGRRLNDYWDTKEKNDQLYNSMTKGTREYSKEKELEVFRRKAISKDIDTALDEYKQAYDDKDIERIEKTRARVIDLVTRYNDNPSTPEMEIYLSNPNAKTMEEAMRARALREISMKDPRDYTKEELADAKALAKEFRQEALLARSDYSYSELLFGITKNDDKVVKIEEVIEGKSEAETKKYLASLKYAGMISNDVIIKLYNAGVINYELGKWANDLESNRNF